MKKWLGMLWAVILIGNEGVAQEGRIGAKGGYFFSLDTEERAPLYGLEVTMRLISCVDFYGEGLFFERSEERVVPVSAGMKLSLGIPLLEIYFGGGVSFVRVDAQDRVFHGHGWEAKGGVIGKLPLGFYLDVGCGFLKASIEKGKGVRGGFVTGLVGYRF